METDVGGGGNIGSLGGAQFYVSCYQLRVTGGGSASPAGVSFPGAYSATDPGILFNLYGTYTSYTVPGPAVRLHSTLKYS